MTTQDEPLPVSEVRAPPAIRLRPAGATVAAALLAGGPTIDVRIAIDYPAELTDAILPGVVGAASFGPYLIHQAEDGLVVGEIAGEFVAAGVVEFGYAVARSCWGQGYATEAVRQLVAIALQENGIERLVAHTPLDRPASARVMEKAGFTSDGEHLDQFEGRLVPVRRWVLAVECGSPSPGPAPSP